MRFSASGEIFLLAESAFPPVERDFPLAETKLYDSREYGYNFPL